MFFLSLLLGSVAFAQAHLPPSPEEIAGCPGDACACSGQPTAKVPLDLYEKRFTKSKRLAQIHGGQEVKIRKVVSLVLDAGRAVVTSVAPEETALHKKDVLTHVWPEGDGESSARRAVNGQRVSFMSSMVELKILREAKYETWTEVEFGKTKGFVKGFPFDGCE